MGTKPKSLEPKKHAVISGERVPTALSALENRLREVQEAVPPAHPDRDALMRIVYRLTEKSKATFREVYGEDTIEGSDTPWFFDYAFAIPEDGPYRHYSWQERLNAFAKGKQSIADQFQTQIELLQEKLSGTSPESGAHRALRAYGALDFHPAIAEAAGELYRHGHYANAIEDAVKALNNLVRLRSGKEIDGEALMTTVFNPKSPVLLFNDPQDASDQDEQRGFMMMFAGAVAGLRNPRAHKLIKDDPERALEFIAFVSLLAKLLDGTKKAPRGQ
jgi:uncharacterized protein (TIGR02391 family)